LYHALTQVRYDTFITVYMSDCDFYPRVRAAGWDTINAKDLCQDLELKVRQTCPKPLTPRQQTAVPELWCHLSCDKVLNLNMGLAAIEPA
jgi:hypothetical protein